MTTAWRTTAQTAHRMSMQARRDTRPEMALRCALHGQGRRFRVSYPVPDLSRCTIDIAFPRQKVAVFVDGCFWHGCPEHGTRPKSNVDRWAEKLDANGERDRRVEAHLRERGWAVLRIWEHEDVVVACEKVRLCLLEADAAVAS